MVKLNILFYTDLHFPGHPEFGFTLEPSEPDEAPKGLSLLRDLILKNKHKGTEIEVTLINRNVGKSGATELGARKLTKTLLSEYDELWFFGYYQKNMPDFDPRTGGPENELNDYEVAALREWMAEGGVLISGDHADPQPPYLGLGRALGYRVPRAGQMRRWEGPPTSNEGDNFNTQSPGRVLDDLDDPNLQDNEEPQHIHLWMDESGSGLPHELFQGSDGIINVLPDHKHEGALEIPAPTGSDWPDGSPVPFVVAWGTDNRHSFPFFNPLISVYDGHQVSVGRIVADSTWHHYTNVNLRSLPWDPVGDKNPRAALNLIGQYYGNLAWWLAPEIKRQEIMYEMLNWLCNHPEVLEVVGSDLLTVGRTAKYVLKSERQTERMSELIETIFPEGLPLYQAPILQVPVLGAVVESYHQNTSNVFTNNLRSGLKDSTNINNILKEGFKLALGTYLGKLEAQVRSYREILDSLS